MSKIPSVHLSEKTFRALIENSSDAIALVSSQGIFTYVSPTVKKVLGYSPHELIGTNANILFPPDESLLAPEKFRKVVENPGRTITVEHKAIKKNKKIVWLESTVTNHINSQDIEAYVASFRDITERKKAEETQANLATIVEFSDDAIISKTLDSIITSWNKAAERIYGYTEEEAIGEHIFLIIPKPCQKEEADIINKLKKGEVIDHYETVRRRKDGREIIVSLTISPIKDANGNIIGASNISRDITERKSARSRRKFMEQLTITMTKSLDEHITLSEIAKLIVPTLADYCRIVVVDKHNTIQELTINHKNPNKVNLTRDLYYRYTKDNTSSMGVPHILQTGKPELLPEVTSAVMDALGTKKSIKDIVKKIGLTSYMGVPMLVRGKVIGAITFSSTQKNRIYVDGDLEFAQEIANRVGLTIDNERLYKEAIDEIQYRKKVEALLQEREERLRTVWESVSDGIVITDKNGFIIDANPAYLKLYGLSPSEILRKHFTAILPESQHKQAVENYKHLFLSKGKPPRYESEIVRPNKEVCIVESRHGFIVENGKRIAMVSMLRDITERKALEQRKNEFISIASHELKTPVTSLKVYAQVLHKRFLKSGDVESAEFVEKMNTQLTKLTNLIIDLLDVSKIEAGKLQFNRRAFDFDELIQEIVEEMQLIANRHTIVIQGKARKILSADRERTAQVIVNFISNAIKYSPKAESIVVHVTSNTKYIQVCVEDFGVGIAEENQEKVFERFYRVSGSTESTFPGLGLGLYISSEIIKRQHGKIWVESPSHGNYGSKFCFLLPLG